VEAIMALVRSYEKGASIIDLASRYGVDHSTVIHHIDRQGVVRLGNQPKLTTNQATKAAQIRSQGWTFARIGRYFGVADVTVANSIRRLK
jgi:lambda repressor-like predicted transcriptional regulator